MVRLRVRGHHKKWTVHVVAQTVLKVVNSLSAVQNFVQAYLTDVVVLSRVHIRLSMLDTAWWRDRVRGFIALSNKVLVLYFISGFSNHT